MLGDHGEGNTKLVDNLDFHHGKELTDSVSRIPIIFSRKLPCSTKKLVSIKDIKKIILDKLDNSNTRVRNNYLYLENYNINKRIFHLYDKKNRVNSDESNNFHKYLYQLSFVTSSWKMVINNLFLIKKDKLLNFNNRKLVEIYSINTRSDRSITVKNFFQYFNKVKLILSKNYLYTGPSEIYYKAKQLFFKFKVIHNAVRYPLVSMPKLKQLKNIHLGKRCFIIGNGPSLSKINLDILKKEITFGSNNIFLLFNKTSWRPNYYFAEDNLLIEDRHKQINQLKNIPKFIPLRSSYIINPENTVFFNHAANILFESQFSNNIPEFVASGHTVTYTMMQFAAYMGFKEIYLLGIDHNYQVPKEYSLMNNNDNYTIVSKQHDANHFHKDYFGKGFRWHNPKVHLMEESYKIAKECFQSSGIKVFNITPNSRLSVFPKIRLNTVLKTLS